MRTKLLLLAVAFSGIGILGQEREFPPEPEPYASVRRFSGAITLSVQGFPLVPNRIERFTSTAPTVDAVFDTAANSQRVTYGAAAQLAISERFAVNAGLFLRRAAYKMSGESYEGTDNPNTATDERAYIVTNEDTRARFVDIPLTLRYYTIDRHDFGPRWFFEFGGALRRVSHVRTWRDKTVNFGTTECCDFTPAPLAHRSGFGFVAGIGGQLIDPLGIRVIPAVRFTRWANRVFDNFSSRSQLNQVEATISLGF